LTTKTLEKLRGIYVPFWLYDYKTDVDYHAVGTKVRHWTRGDRRYTETSYFNVYRKLHINFDGIPVDASLAMDDKIMDLMEPYKYGGLIPNDNKYLSGFEAETYNYTPDQMEPRAIDKINNDTDEWIKKATSNYTTLTNVNKNVHHSRIANRFALLPVWEYEYRYNGQNYKFYVNGQTGKCVGTAPLSKEKAFGMSTIFGVALFACLEMLFLLLGVM
jgi:hypothetical protein